MGEAIQVEDHLVLGLVDTPREVPLGFLQEDTQVVVPLVEDLVDLVDTPREVPLAFLQEDTQVVVPLVEDRVDLVDTPMGDTPVAALLVDQVEVIPTKVDIVAGEMTH